MAVPPTEMTGLDKLVEDFPQVPLLVLGQGVPFAAQYASLFAGSKLYLDVSRCEGVAGVADLVRLVGADHVLFGSHAPLFYLEAAVLKLQEAGLSAADREAVLYHNALGVLA